METGDVLQDDDSLAVDVATKLKVQPSNGAFFNGASVSRDGEWCRHPLVPLFNALELKSKTSGQDADD